MSPEPNTGKSHPRPRSVWQHRDGDIYKVVMLANEATEQPDRYPVTVVYRGKDGKVWSRPLSDWHRSMTPAHHEERVARRMKLAISVLLLASFCAAFPWRWW